jgi:copper transport protein
VISIFPLQIGPIGLYQVFNRGALLRALLTIMVAAVILLGTAQPSMAHAELLSSDPPSQGVLTVPPQQLDLWFSETVAAGEGSPSLRVIDVNGNDLSVSGVSVDPTDAKHITADLAGALSGTYTVIWMVRSATDGHTLNGTYAFRVGAGRTPGAATVQGETPQPWAVASRWLTFLGIAIASAGFVFGFLPADAESTQALKRRRSVVIVGALIALLATLSEPFLQTRWPPTGAIAPSLRDAIKGLPDAWWIRPGCLIPAIGLALYARYRSQRGQALDWIGAAILLSGLLGLSLTSHSAAETGFWHAPAIASNMLHQVCIALWVGGLAHVALWWAGRQSVTSSAHSTESNDRTIRRFSRIALVLVSVGVATGVINAGLVLPALRSLWSSDYGVVLLVKVGILTIPLALATFHYRVIRRAIASIWPAIHRTVRIEAMLVLAVVLVGSTLALLAPPIIGSKAVTLADVPKPAMSAFQGQDLLVHLLFKPGKSGENELGIQLSKYDRSAYTGDQPARIRLRFISLDTQVEAGPLEMQLTPDGAWSGTSSEMGFDGWWRVEATLRWLGQEDVIVPFYLLLPDPNLNGFDAPETKDSDPNAAALYEQAMGAYTGMHTVRYVQTMSSNTGSVGLTHHAVNDGSDGSTPGLIYSAAGGYDTVIIGTTAWTKRPGVDWRTLEVNPLIPPSEWDNEYVGATGFRLGRIEEIDGVPAQIFTFVVPDNGQQVTAWYAWWVSVSTGDVLRTVMVSKGHYMTSDYAAFDEPLTILPPDLSATPSPK